MGDSKNKIKLVEGRQVRAVWDEEHDRLTREALADVDAGCECVCARCNKEFEFPLHKHVIAYLTEESDDEIETDCYTVCNDRIDLNEVIVSEILLDLNERILCNEDCAGLCPKCGLDLNTGTCDCKEDIDPRLAKLAQLL